MLFEEDVEWLVRLPAVASSPQKVEDHCRRHWAWRLMTRSLRDDDDQITVTSIAPISIRILSAWALHHSKAALKICIDEYPTGESYPIGSS